MSLLRLRRSFHRSSFTRLVTGVSLAFAALACQTASQKNDPPNNLEKNLLDSQLTLVQNSLDQGQPQRAYAILRDALARFPDNPMLHNFMGLTQLALQNPKRATEHFDQSFKLSPQVGVGLNYSSALIVLEDYKGAIIRLKDLLKQANSESYQFKERIYHNIGYALIKAKKNKEAIVFLKKSIEENPTFFPAHLELGRLYGKLNHLADASQSLRRAHDYCMMCWEPIEELVKIYVSQGLPAEAHKLLVSYLKQNDVPEPHRELARQSLRQSMETNSRLTQAPGIVGKAQP